MRKPAAFNHVSLDGYCSGRGGDAGRLRHTGSGPDWEVVGNGIVHLCCAPAT